MSRAGPWGSLGRVCVGAVAGAHPGFGLAGLRDVWDSHLGISQVSNRPKHARAGDFGAFCALPCAGFTLLLRNTDLCCPSPCPCLLAQVVCFSLIKILHSTCCPF